jgi:hypothetical protein
VVLILLLDFDLNFYHIPNKTPNNCFFVPAILGWGTARFGVKK